MGAYSTTVGITQSNGAQFPSAIAPGRNSNNKHPDRRMAAKYAVSAELSTSDTQKDQHYLELSKEEHENVDLLQEHTTKTQCAEAIPDAIATNDVKSVILPDMEGIEESAKPDLLQGLASESSGTQELATQESHRNLRESEDEPMEIASQHVINPEEINVLPAASMAEFSSDLEPPGPTTTFDTVTSDNETLEEVIQIASTPKMSVFFTVARALRLLAESLELCEKPLEPGLQRIRWTCVCGYVVSSSCSHCHITVNRWERSSKHRSFSIS